MHSFFFSSATLIAVALLLIAVAAAAVTEARWDWNGNDITRAALRRDANDPTRLVRYELPSNADGQPDSVTKADDKNNATFNNYTGSLAPTDNADHQDFGPLVAFATLKRHYMQKGWDFVEFTAANATLATNKSLAYYGVGYLEGYYTWDSISDVWYNWGVPLNISIDGDAYFHKWLNDHIAYLKDKSNGFDPMGDEKKNGRAAASVQVGKLMRWLDGLVEGYQAAVKDMRAAGVKEAKDAPNLGYFEFFLLQFQDEVGDVQQGEPGSKLNPNACPPKTTATTAAPPTTTAAAATTTGVNESRPEMMMILAADEQRDATILVAAKDKMLQRWNEHCSSLVKLTDDDVLITHTTWSHQRTMGSRQYKTYHLEHTLVLSGYPSNFASSDDWVITSHRIVATETTNNQFSNELSAKYVLSNSVSEWLRVAVANLLATTGEEWPKLFINGSLSDGDDWSGWNSGTYCNQQIILDLNQIDDADLAAKKLKPNTLWILEQVPGPYSASADMTWYVNDHAYWPSFNRNYFQETADVSCVSYYAASYGPVWGYKDYCRYEIFRREQHTVVSTATMQDMIRYNNYKNDPASRIPWCDGCVPAQGPSLSIAARYDLIPVSQEYGNASSEIRGYLKHNLDGAIDAKIVGYRSIIKRSPFPSSASASTSASGFDYGNNAVYNSTRPFLFESSIICGPTTSHGIPPFKWSDYAAEAVPPYGSHRGMPDVFNFSWVTTVDSLSPPPEPVPGKRKATPTWTAVIVSACVVGTIVISVVIYKTLFAREVPPSHAEIINSQEESAAADGGQQQHQQHGGDGGTYSPAEREQSPSQPLIK